MNQISISKTIEWDAGHRVPNSSKCRHPHGHRYRVRLTCEGLVNEDEQSPEFGMVVDFSFLGFLLKTFVHDIYDHSFIVHKDDKELLEALSGHDWRIVEFPYVPTAENLARYIYNALKTEVMELSDGRAQLSMVTVWETPTSVAMYAEDA